MPFSSTCLFFDSDFSSIPARYFFQVNEGHIFFLAFFLVLFSCVLSVMQHQGEAKSYNTLHTSLHLLSIGEAGELEAEH